MSLRGRSEVWDQGRSRGKGRGRGPQMMTKDSLFLLISNILGRGPSHDDEGISVCADFKCFRKGA